jgi:hypothetical protein
VAIDQESSPGEADLKLLRRSAIENEIPTYRAVSTRAVFAVLCGLMAALSFAHPAFYLFAVAAVALGFWADRSIQRYPDLLTGQGLARAGVAMGLVFGLSIFTITSVQAFLARREAGAFAAEYARMVKTGTLADLYWLNLAPQARASISPEENLKQMQGQKQEAPMTEMKFGGLNNLHRAVQGGAGGSITFSGIEDVGREDLTLVALALYDVQAAPAPHEHKEGEEHDHAAEAAPQASHAMAVIKGVVPEGKSGYEWWVDDVTYPYVPKTAALPETQKKSDDGHGHAH